MDQSKAKKGKSCENASESLPPQPPRKEKKTENQRLQKTFELLTTCSNQTMNDECQHFGNMIASNLRNYNEMARCIIQNEIMNVFLNANRGLHERYHPPISSQLTHLKPTSQVVHLNVPSKYQSSSAHFSFIPLFSKPFAIMFWKHFSVTSQSLQ